jgi:hypothetical protein
VTIDREGLGPKLFPGLLWNYSIKRDRPDLSFDDDVLVMNFMNELAILDISSGELNRVIEDISGGIRLESADALRRYLALAAGLVLAFSIAFFFVLRFFRDFLNLRATRNKMIEAESEDALRDILEGESVLDAEGHARFESAAASVRDLISGTWTLLLFRVDGYKAFCLAYSNKDRALIFGRALESFRMEFESRGQMALGATFDDHLTLLVKTGRLDGESRSLEAMARELIRLAAADFGLGFSATLSDPTDGPESIANLYRLAIKASDRRFVEGRGVVLRVKTKNEDTDTDYNYPLEVERRICLSLKEGKIEEAHRFYSDMIESARPCGTLALQNALFRLAIAVESTVETVGNSAGIDLCQSRGSLVSDLKDCLDLRRRGHQPEARGRDVRTAARIEGSRQGDSRQGGHHERGLHLQAFQEDLRCDAQRISEARVGRRIPRPVDLLLGPIGPTP